MANEIDIIQLIKHDGTLFYPLVGIDAVPGLAAELDKLPALQHDVGTLKSYFDADGVVKKTDTEWGDEPGTGTEADLKVNGVTKRLLKTNALEYDDKIVGLIEDKKIQFSLDTFFPTK